MLANELLKSCPFYNHELNGIERISVRPIRDIVFIWQMQTPEKLQSIYLPDVVRKSYQIEVGVVIATGKGWHDGVKFNPIRVLPGQVVVFEKRTPWKLDIPINGDVINIRMVGDMDIKLILDEDERVDNIGELCVMTSRSKSR